MNTTSQKPTVAQDVSLNTFDPNTVLGSVATEAFRHALAGGHLHDLYSLPERMKAHQQLHAVYAKKS